VSAGRLARKIAFITGVAGGQGRAAAQLFTAEGAAVVGCDIDLAGSQDTQAIIREAGGKVMMLDAVDLSDRRAVIGGSTKASPAWAASTFSITTPQRLDMSCST
jgi:NAD(P)-dependent dehydrogenase (short-subunit alcohol dehydrogenase family)